MINLTIEELVKYLGMPEKKIGDEYQWQCPICKDTGRDNLKFNEKKGLLQCFAVKEHTKVILKNLFKSNQYNLFSSNKINISKIESDTYEKFQPIYTKEKQEEFLSYLLQSSNELQNNTKFSQYLFNKRGINKETAETVGLGIDVIQKRWVIPTFQYSTEETSIILGFEYRPLDLGKKGLYREKNTPTGLAMINAYTPQKEVLAIVEGYFDGYALLQYLNEQKQSQYYHIVTPSNGVQALSGYIQQIDFTKYKKYWLFLDNDDAGNSVSNCILEMYPMFNAYSLKCGCKDFNEHYLKCIKAQS